MSPSMSHASASTREVSFRGISWIFLPCLTVVRARKRIPVEYADDPVFAADRAELVVRSPRHGDGANAELVLLEVEYLRVGALGREKIQFLLYRPNSFEFYDFKF